jgi:hypothetical protein
MPPGRLVDVSRPIWYKAGFGLAAGSLTAVGLAGTQEKRMNTAAHRFACFWVAVAFLAMAGAGRRLASAAFHFGKASDAPGFLETFEIDGNETDGPCDFTLIDSGAEGNTRIVELALPGSEIPHVRQRADAGETVKFSFRVDHNRRGPTMELAAGRSVSKPNNQAFHPDWAEHWANELEFAFEK